MYSDIATSGLVQLIFMSSRIGNSRMGGKAQRDGRPRCASKLLSNSLLFVDQSAPAYVNIFYGDAAV